MIDKDKEGNELPVIETRKAAVACADYLQLGTGRSLRKLLQKYADDASGSVPTKHLRVLQTWSAKYNWVERAREYDAAISAEKEEKRREVLGNGLALEYERINELTEIYGKLKEELTQNGLWYTDTKLSATGRTIDVDVFNKALLDSLRGVLDDIAKEVGGRKQKIDHSPISVSATHSGKVEVEQSVSTETVDGVLEILKSIHAFASIGEFEEDQDSPGEVVSR